MAYQKPRAGTFEFQIERSVVFANTEDNTFLIDNNGILFDPTSVKIKDDWALARLAHQLPFDYKVK